MIKSVINEIVLAIADKIKKIKEYADYPIYTDKEEQGLDKPCFFIKVLNGEEKREIGLQDKFYKDTLNIAIIGYTLDGNTEIINDMIDNLYELEYIELSDKSLIRADKLHHRTENGILNFFIDYNNLFIKKDSIKTIKMKNYNLNGEVKNEDS